MTTKLTAHFDGKVIVPDGPVDLPVQEQLTIHVEPGEPSEGMLGEEMISLIRDLKFDREDVAAMQRAIGEDCERIDPDGW